MRTRTGVAAAVALLAGMAAAVPEMGYDSESGFYVITVPAEEVYPLTDADVAAIGSYSLKKMGPGTLSAGAEMAAYEGDIHIVEGVYRVAATGGVGTADGATYAEGGTLENCLYGSSDWTTGSALGNEPLFLGGTGHDNHGALWQTTSDCNKITMGKITLTSDTLIVANKLLDFRHTTMAMDGHKITKDGPGAFRMTGCDVATASSGDIDILRGGLHLESGSSSTTYSNRTITIRSGCFLSFRASAIKPWAKLVLEDGTWIKSTYDSKSQYVPDTAASCNRWFGPVEIQGTVTNRLDAGTYMDIQGPVSGIGTIVGGNGGWIRFGSPTNTLEGGVAVTGAISNGVPTGGIEISATGTVFSAATSMSISNAQLQVFAPVARVTLPPFVCGGDGVISGGVTYASTHTEMPSLVKNGTGTLVFHRPVKVTGRVEVNGGTLRFGCRVPDVESGLNYRRKVNPPPRTGSTSSGSYASGNKSTALAYPLMGVEPSGPGMAFKTWTVIGMQYSHHTYTGYLVVPGEATDSVTWTFASRIARYSWVQIDGNTILDIRDNRVYEPVYGGGDYDQFDYSRFAVSRPVTLNGGFHEIFIYMGNTYYSGGGALSALNQGDTKWAEYFGLGLNRSGTCSSNSTDYVKLLDPGDGSLLRASLAEKVDIDPVSYRPSFEGAVAFAAGTVFDMGDTVPYSPFTVSSFEGATTVSNGLLVLSGTWTPGDDAVAAGGTLLAADGATIRFTAGATLTLPGDDLPKSFNAHPLVACQGTGSIEGSENLAIVQSGHRWRAEWAAGGQSLNLVYIPKGTVVTFR